MEKFDNRITQSSSSLNKNGDDSNESHAADIEENLLLWFPPKAEDEEALAVFDQYDENDPPSDPQQSILISSSSLCVPKGTACEKPHLLRIEFHGSFDTTMDCFLKEHLLNQSYICTSCDMPSEAHVHSYCADPKNCLFVTVKKLPEILSEEGKVWAWQRCLKCPRTKDNGFLLPPSTHRTVVTESFLRISFARFLKMCFTNHSAESICGHTLHRDCLTFFGFENMVACFRCSSIDVHSIKLPPQKLSSSSRENDDHQQNTKSNGPTNIIARALELPDYQVHLSDFGTFRPFLETMSESYISHGTEDITVTFNNHDQLVNGGDEVCLHSVTCYYAKIFEAIRSLYFPSQADFIRSLRSFKNGNNEEKKSFEEERFLVKEVTKAELESFTDFAQDYFKYIFQSIASSGPSCLAKILGIYQVSSKCIKEGNNKGSKTYLMVMENHLFGRRLTRVYDLKGYSRNRNDLLPDKVLLDDEKMIERMKTSPIFVWSEDKRLLERAVWNDTAFLASAGVSEYSLLVGVDGDSRELAVGIVGYAAAERNRTTWNNQLVKTCAKALGIGGGNSRRTSSVSPKEYKKRFREAMASYFLLVPSKTEAADTVSEEDYKA